MKKSVLIFITFIFLNCSHNVNYVLDGDTVILNNNKTVRLYGIDAPEMQQPYGKKSRDFLISLVNNKEIKLTQKGVDKYGRVIGIIHINGQNVNELLIKNGFAWVYKKYYNRSRVNWMILEDKAKRNKLGLWKQDNPLEPWKFRNN